ESERLWCVWRVLAGNDLAAEEELPRLEELFTQAFPAAEDRKAALGWVRAFRARTDQEFASFQRSEKGKSHSANVGARAEICTRFKQVLPPPTRRADLWILYRYVGLSPASREAARARWLDYFPAANQ